jgi:hypothetical protein
MIAGLLRGQRGCFEGADRLDSDGLGLVCRIGLGPGCACCVWGRCVRGPGLAVAELLREEILDRDLKCII